jgi:hypothetical protein
MLGRAATARVTSVDLEEHLVRLPGRVISAGCATTVIRSRRCCGRSAVAVPVPHAFDACFNSSPAVPGDDQRGIMAVLGLTDAVPATYPLGETLVGHLSHGGPDRREDFAHVLISPQLNDRTVARGPSCDPDRP